jgi:hypothetical protein
MSSARVPSHQVAAQADRRTVVGRGACCSSPACAVAFGRPQTAQGWHRGGMLTIFGVVGLTFMMAMYGLESRGRVFVLAFALGCALSSAYGFLSGAWPFGGVEAVWVVVAARRWWTAPSQVTQ